VSAIAFLFLTEDNKEKKDCSFAGTKWAPRRLGFLLFKTFPLFRHNLAPDLGQYRCGWLQLDLTNRIKPYEKQRSQIRFF
jgi:hypothetical protein